jgi:hypothetical protein
MIEKYINKCKDVHVSDGCMMMESNGYCFLCNAKHGDIPCYISIDIPPSPIGPIGNSIIMMKKGQEQNENSSIYKRYELVM